jgi:uncharacterized protein
MPVTPTYPGVYIEEIPSGVRTITGVATSITAFVGYTAEGPVDKAVRIFNFGDFERNFGGLNRESEISYAVQQFFLNGGGDAYVVRAVQGAVAAQISLKDANNTAVLQVTAAAPGLWGNYVRLDVDYATTNSDSTFNLTVTRYGFQDSNLVPMAVEQYRNLSLNKSSPSYVENVVNAASKLIKVTRPTSLTFSSSGFSLSGKLNPFPTLTAQEKTLNIIVDGKDPVTLTLTSIPTGISELVTAVTSAIGAGLPGRLAAERVDALGNTAAVGDYFKITSTDTTERSAVQIIPSGNLDASSKLKLGRSNGGREREGASSRRPAPTGTTSADLADLVGTSISGDLNILVNDNSTTPPVAIFTGATPTITLPSSAVGSVLANKLQELLRGIDNPATKNATVRFVGTTLQVLPSASTPNASISFTGAAAGPTAARLMGTGSFSNVQQYSLGVGPAFGAQTGAVGGANGSPPNASTLMGSYTNKTGMYALRDVDLFNLLVIPFTAQMEDNEAKSVMAAAIAFCKEERAFYLVDPHPSKTWDNIGDWVSGLGASERNAAIFFPHLQVADPLDGFRLKNVPPSGTVAGVFARTDASRGVWKAPAGIDATLTGVQGLAQTLTDQENGALNPLGINCIRSFLGYGRVVWGARTLRGGDQFADEYKYIPVRRLALYIEESLFRGLKWVVFEGNDEPLWSQIRLNAGAFMHNLFRQGAFQGTTPRDAYFVKCDKETTTQNDINLGIVNIVVGFAPLKPAEFVILKLQQMAGQIQV